MILQQVFMCRGSEEGSGFFNTNFEIKLIFLLIIIGLVIWDIKDKKRIDYRAILTTGTITWSLAELIMQLTGIRELQIVYIFGWELPFLLQVVIKGCVEGAGVAIFCMFFSDRIMFGEKKTRLLWGCIYTVALTLLFLDAFKEGIQIPDYGGIIPSRRSMIEPISLMFLFIFSSIGVVWYLKSQSKELKRRAFNMFISMIVFGTVWTLAEYFAGTRWIEVGTFSSSFHAPPLIEFFALSFDVVVEIALVYVPFFVIPILTKDIKINSERNSSSQSIKE